ncbi:MAG TPA: response regulator [Chloroflexota bacterium]|nr:response regulator [Chloroflexota bacterium]
MRVLIAEDSALERRLLEAALRKLGHEPVLAADGQEAWERFLAERPAVIISDWLMPLLDGDELCRRVRAHASTGYTYFIFLSMLDDREHMLRGMELGADDYLLKPLNLYDLQLRLIAAERVTRLHQELAEARLAQGRLEGVQMAARTLQHELGNTLALTAGYVELVATRAAVPAQWQPAMQEALRGIETAMRIVQQLQGVTRVAVTEWGRPALSTLDLARSTR